MNIKKCNKKVGLPCLLSRQQAFKMGYSVYWLSVKNSNYLHAEFSLGYLGEAKFYLESKASFIDISSIASFKRFLIAWLREYCTFSDSSVVGLRFSPWAALAKIHPVRNYFPPKNHVPLSNVFSSSNMFFIRLLLANTWKKNWGSPCSFKRKGEFISLLVWGKSLSFCTCTRSRARANDVKIVRSSDAQCNTKEVPYTTLSKKSVGLQPAV